MARGAAATYAFPVSLDQNYMRYELGVKLVPGRFGILAQFDGRGATNINLDTQGVALMNFWKGTVQ
jgi:hypothetical protein